MTRAGRRLTAEITRAIQEECGVSKSAALSGILGPVCELAAGRAKTGKRIRALERSVAALMRSETAPPMPAHKPVVIAPANPADLVSRMNRAPNGHDLHIPVWRHSDGQEAQ